MEALSSLSASTTQSRWSLPPESSKLPCRHQGCSCLCFQSLVSRLMLCRWTSGSAAIAGLSPCWGGRPVLPSQYALAALLPDIWHWPSWCRPMLRREAHTPVLQRPFAFLPFRGFYQLSCEERPRGRLPACAWDDVATPIRSITERRSLFPRSYSRTTIGRLCSLLSPKGAIRGCHVPLAKVHRVRCLLSTGRLMGHGGVIR